MACRTGGGTNRLGFRSFRMIVAFACLSMILFSCFQIRAQETEKPKRVLVLYWYGKELLPNVMFEQAFHVALQKAAIKNVEYYSEFLESDRFAGEAQDQIFRDYLQRRYAGRPIDVVVAVTGAPLDFFLKYKADLFPNAPIVFEAINRPSNEQLAAGPGMTGVIPASTHKQTLDLALKLHPDTEQVFVISGNLEHDKSLENIARKELAGFDNRVRMNYLTDLTPADLARTTSNLPKRSIILYVWQQARDEKGRIMETWEVLPSIAPSASAPIYGMGSANVGRGLAGGYVSGPAERATRIAEMTVRILNGERAQNIPVENAPASFMFDWRELRRWKINENNLPAGSVVLFKQLSFWELYKWYAVGLVTAVIIEALLIAWLLFLRARRRQAELESQRLARVAADEHQRLGEIVSNVPGIVWESRIDSATKQRKTTFISDYLQKMLGYTPEEWLSAPPGLGFRIIPEEDREKARRESEAIVASGIDGISQFRWQAKDGSIHWVENYLSPVKDPNNGITGLRGVALDVTERKHTEQKNQAILQAIPDVMFVYSPEGIFLDYHAKDPASLLLPPEVFLGKSIREVLPPYVAEQFAKCFARAAENGEPQILEYKLTIDGAERWFEARMVRAGGNILSVRRDITERKNSEAEIRASEERFAKAFKANPQPMSITTLAEGRYVDVNDSFLAMSGYTREEVIGRTSLELTVWDSPLTRAEFIRRLQRDGSIVNTETTFRGKNGRIRTLLSSAEFVELSGENCLLVASSDITERVQAQQALRESEKRFRNMADTAPVMIWVADTDKMCTYFNQQGLDFTGLTMEQAQGYGWAESLHPDDSEQSLEIYNSSFDARQPFRMEYRLRHADGTYRWIFASGTARFSEAGKFLGYIGTCVDITDRKNSEEALRVAHEEVSRLKNQLHEENIYLREEIELEHNFREIIGRSDALKYVLFKIEQVAPTDTTVLITGETGTGKELVARAIHNASARRGRPMVRVNCAALSPSLIESEFFGHEKGAFTGASARKIGRFELANGATIFLDEIGELSLELQVKLLRVIQEGEFERLGSSNTIKVDLRIIAATNRNLDAEVKKGLFREDLWYRLNVFPITVPPLRQRREDIPLLIEHFVRESAKKLRKVITSVSPTTLKTLRDYSWPGNVRELANVLERAVINSHGSVLRIGGDFAESEPEIMAQTNKTLDELERDYIVRILNETGWRIEGRHGAAPILGINPSTLRARMVKLGIQKPGHGFSISAGKGSG